jgi:hypothetical protein
MRAAAPRMTSRAMAAAAALALTAADALTALTLYAWAHHWQWAGLARTWVRSTALCAAASKATRDLTVTLRKRFRLRSLAR